VLRLLARLRDRLGLTYVLITHDLSVARRFATQVLVLSRGRAVESGRVPDVFEAPSAAQTRELLDAVLSLDPAVARAQLGE
jgi:ABC-type glutathione transport system ATPase component